MGLIYLVIHIGNTNTLISQFVKAIDAPICIAWKIDSYNKIDFIKSIKPWSITIGSAFFYKLGNTFKEQIDTLVII